MIALVNSSKPLVFDDKGLKSKPNNYRGGFMSSVHGQLSMKTREVHDQTVDMHADMKWIIQNGSGFQECICKKKKGYSHKLN